MNTGKLNIDMSANLLIKVGFALPFLIFLLFYSFELFSVSLLAILLLIWFGNQKHINLFNSFTLFSIYYFTVIPTALYFYFTDFKNTLFITETSFNNNINDLFLYCLWFFIFGWLSSLFGYKLFATKKQFTLQFKENYSDFLINFLIFIFCFIGLCNFAWNVLYFADGNLLNYFANISVRYYEFKEAGTTIGYLFLELAAYLGCYQSLKYRRKISFFTYLLIILTFIVRLSTGRIFQSLAILATFACVYYLSLSSNKTNKNYKFIGLGFGLGVCGVLIYFFRITSSLHFIGDFSGNWITQILSFLNFETVFKFAIDKGNMPNIPVCMKIIDSWETDIGFLYGRSLYEWVFSFLPKIIRPEYNCPGILVKQIWYEHIPGGNLPPTGIGEMYANFGFLGPIFGMFGFGVFAAYMWNILVKLQSYWMLAIYSNISINFFFLFAKGEFNNLTLWQIIPFIAIYLFLKILTLIFSTSSKTKNDL